MSLQQRAEAYLRKAIRKAQFTQPGGDGWLASLPAFGLSATGDSRDDVELKLYAMLTVYVLGARESGWRLPIIDDIDLNVARSQPGPPNTQGHAVSDSSEPDQSWFWTDAWQAGEQEASEDIASGRVEVFDSADEFLASFPD